MPATRAPSWRRHLRHFFHKSLNFIFPPVCVSCQQVGNPLCDDCRALVVRPQEPLCPHCGRTVERTVAACGQCRRHPLPLRIRAAALHAGPLRQAVHALKYEGMFALASPLAALMVEEWPRWRMPADLVVPIPLHPERERERGYNQALLLVREFCRRLNLVPETTALRRVRYTRPQVELGVRERLHNVRGAFQADGNKVAQKRILLVDDVCTTGATLASAADALLSAGARSVNAYVLARAVGDQDKI